VPLWYRRWRTGECREVGEDMDIPLVAIIDDSPEILSLMGEVLTDAGYRVVMGESTDEVDRILAGERPGLLVLDIRLPGAVTGLPLLRAIREKAATANLPILIATADVTFLRGNAGELKTLGCETVQKPFDIDALLMCVGALLPVGTCRQS
jgi:DNA-binding response OmpR family regulator